MDKFVAHSGKVMPLRRSDVDTDQIIPAVYLKRVTRTGFEDGLFNAWREDPDFVLNRPRHAGATILVAGPNFGTGSSRQHAVWALRDWGFKAVIASRFGDIFRGNSLKEGLLPIQLDQKIVESLWDLAESEPEKEITVDLEGRVVRVDDAAYGFPIDDFSRWRLMEGLDDIGLTLRHEGAITAYEKGRPAFKPAVVL
ncbi:3-isopropylmalate/(R)-2-methylmalate dehydratase small subunit [Actinoplanes campanulatus]|uniref:3-isopropylmalate dehydratase small subunit n=1 Tax=Actinoplanes campanulatus TaxID=113559 RepID=A0A7W5FCD6_9ACTN|nr:3-isopropylmalate dehydratase small subunit [Actinoplanes campanulatus]MBB3093177.1 3-isopropylmalate/(R)-2-methylmalate dehydratase small subunit [Actinoplanes campanulatus]GGN01732.1 3-isopropylmalate dehydratase small subunit [Actinoplanes campanulatus]GID33727.1 3-isopropylmalate dehydratase small subunit [Actinoplanes campanulatus]